MCLKPFSFQVTHAWPGLPRGVKFDPSDPEIIWHLLAKVGVGNLKPHPFIEEFIPTVEEDDGICYTHPQNLPGMYRLLFPPSALFLSYLRLIEF